jgi:hypothetical protein
LTGIATGAKLLDTNAATAIDVAVVLQIERHTDRAAIHRRKAGRRRRNRDA